MTEQHKKAISEGRALNKKKREAGIDTTKKKTSVWDKPIVQYTGKEKDAFDFVHKVKNAYCSQGNYITYHKVVKEITDPKIWENVGIILRILEKYCIMEKDTGEIKKPIKEKKERKPRNSTYVMTDEHKAKLKAAREAKKVLDKSQ